MKIFGLQRRTLALFAVILALLLLFIYVALRAGPLAPIAVTTTQVELRSLAPSLFGIGTVEAGYTYKIGPTHTSRLKQINVQVGDLVTAGQVLGEMNNVNLADKLIVVTHDEKIIPTFKRIYYIRDGITHEEVGEGRLPT